MRVCTLALLNDRAEVVAHRLMRLDLSSSLRGIRIREIREAFIYTKWELKLGTPSNVTARPRKAPLRCEPPYQWRSTTYLDLKAIDNNFIGRDSRRSPTRRLCFNSMPSLPLSASRQTD